MKHVSQARQPARADINEPSLIRRGVVLVEQATAWRETADLNGCIELICDMEEFIRDWLASDDQIKRTQT